MTDPTISVPIEHEEGEFGLLLEEGTGTGDPGYILTEGDLSITSYVKRRYRLIGPSRELNVLSRTR